MTNRRFEIVSFLIMLYLNHLKWNWSKPLYSIKYIPKRLTICIRRNKHLNAIWNWSNVENVKTKRRKKDQLRFQIQVNLKASRIFRQFPLKIPSIPLSKQDKSKFNICDVLKYTEVRGKDGRWLCIAPCGKLAKWPSERRTPVYLFLLFRMMLFHDYLSTGRMINMIPKGNMAVLSKYTTAAIHLDILLDLIVSGNFPIQLKYLHWYINTGSS